MFGPGHFFEKYSAKKKNFNENNAWRLFFEIVTGQVLLEKAS